MSMRIDFQGSTIKTVNINPLRATQRASAKALGVDHSTVSRDLDENASKPKIESPSIEEEKPAIDADASNPPAFAPKWTRDLNLPGSAVDTGPLTEEISIPCSKRFKRLFDFVCKVTEKEMQVLGHGYLLAGILEDLNRHFEVEPYLDKTLRELLR